PRRHHPRPPHGQVSRNRLPAGPVGPVPAVAPPAELALAGTAPADPGPGSRRASAGADPRPSAGGPGPSGHRSEDLANLLAHPGQPMATLWASIGRQLPS